MEGLKKHFDSVCRDGMHLAFVPDEFLWPLYGVLQSQQNGNRAAAVGGEMLFRKWLYRAGHGVSIEAGCAALLPRCGAGFQRAWDACMKGVLSAWGEALSVPEQRMAEWFIQRVNLFEKASGIVPVVISGVAFPIPFTVGKKDLSAPRCFTNERGASLEAWDREAQGLWEAGVPKHRIRVHVPAGVSLSGASFALPVLVALEHTLMEGGESNAILASGAIRDGRILAVEGCDAKAELAEKMGVRVWIFSGQEGCRDGGGGGVIVPLEPGTPVEEVRMRVREAMGEAGLRVLDVRGAVQMLKRLQGSGVHEAAQLAGVRTCSAVLSEAVERGGAAHLREMAFEARMLLASLLNHSGDPGGAEQIFREVLSAEVSPKMLARMLGKRVVSLTDMGCLQDAVVLGRRFVALAETEGRDWNELDRLRMRLEAFGSLGGEALLHQALRSGDRVCVDESRVYLEKGLDQARQLHDLGENEVLKSMAREALWYACFKPDEVWERITDAEKAAARAQDEVSLQYLRRVRFFAAYRRLFQGETGHGAISSWTEWELPEARFPFLRWVRASALKYRAALWAASQRPARATEDLREALRWVGADAAPVMGVVRWSIAVEAHRWGLENTCERFTRTLCEDRVDALDYLRADPSGGPFAIRLEQGNLSAEEWSWFQRQYPY